MEININIFKVLYKGDFVEAEEVKFVITGESNTTIITEDGASIKIDPGINNIFKLVDKVDEGLPIYVGLIKPNLTILKIEGKEDGETKSSTY